MFLISFISILFDLINFAIIARIILSWLRISGAGRIKLVLHDITEPILAPFRKPVFQIGMMDISPIVVLFLLDLGKSLLINIVNNLLQNL